MPKSLEEIENIPHADASDKAIEDLIKKLKVFKETEFADLLHECHNVIRNREKLDPAAAFDEIAKILFVKVYVERELKTKRRRVNIFTADYLDDQIGDDPLNDLFEKTKQHFKGDQIFTADTRINLKASTDREIVAKLERYDLSETSEDIKGIAFERFLGRTFRGEIGQFFTPRTIVEFMVHMLDPQEGDVICDPASGSGGCPVTVTSCAVAATFNAASWRTTVFTPTGTFSIVRGSESRSSVSWHHSSRRESRAGLTFA